MYIVYQSVNFSINTNAQLNDFILHAEEVCSLETGKDKIKMLFGNKRNIILKQSRKTT